MTNSLLSLLANATVVSSIAVGLALLARKPFRRYFGPGQAYFVWLLVPISLLVLCFPAPRTTLTAALAVPLFVSSLTRRRRAEITSP